MFTPILCLALALADPPTAEVVTRSYDISTIAPPGRAAIRSIQVTPIQPGTDSFEDGAEPVAPIEPEQVMEMVRTVVAPDEWELPGRWLELGGDGGRLLMVAAPDAVQREVERCLAFLGEALASPITVRVDVYRTESGDPLANPNRAKLVQTFRSSLRSCVPAALRAEKLVQYVRDFDVEIAEGAARHEPVIDRYSIGTTGQIVAQRGSKGDVLVSFAIRHAWEREKSSDVDLNLFHEIRTDNAVNDVPAGGVIETPHLGFATIAGSARLSEGRTAHAYVAARPGQGGVLVDVTVEQASSPAQKFECGERELMIIDIGGDLASGFRAPDDENWQLANARGDSVPIEFVLPPIRVSRVDDELVDRTNQAISRTGLEDTVIWAQTVHHWIVCCAKRGLAEPMMNGALAALVPRRDCPPLVLDLADRGTEKAERVAILPAAVGHAFALAGTQSTFVLDYEVDVANHASTINPAVRALVDGMAVWSRGSATNGAAHFDIQAKASLLESNARHEEPRSHLNGRLDSPRLATSFIDVSIDLRAGRGRAGVELGTLALPEDRQGTLTAVPPADE